MILPKWYLRPRPYLLGGCAPLCRTAGDVPTFRISEGTWAGLRATRTSSPTMTWLRLKVFGSRNPFERPHIPARRLSDPLRRVECGTVREPLPSIPSAITRLVTQCKPTPLSIARADLPKNPPGGPLISQVPLCTILQSNTLAF